MDLPNDGLGDGRMRRYLAQNPQIAEACSIKCRELKADESGNRREYMIEFDSAVRLIVLERNSVQDSTYHMNSDMVGDYLVDGFTIKTYRAMYVMNGDEFADDE